LYGELRVKSEHQNGSALENGSPEVSIKIPWSEDPEENRKTMQAAIDAGATKLVGEPGRIYILKGIKATAAHSSLGENILASSMILGYP
jgi:hypothetical protein